MLYTKSIIKPKEFSDGIRISVMSRHTLNDGITPDSRISLESYDEWLKVFGPPGKLIGDYYKKNLSWNLYEKRYIEYISSSEIKDHVKKLASRALITDITLLCIEDSAEFCHRRLLAEECQKIFPELDIVHK